MALDYERIAHEVVEAAGGPHNIKTVAHCATRLRVTLVDKDKADIDTIQKIAGVLGCIYATEQLQTVFGMEVLGVYDAVLKVYPFADSGEVDAEPEDKGPLTLRSGFDRVIGFVAGAVAPLVPGLIAGGMLKVFLLLASYVSPGFAETNTNTILGWVANAPFYFMPIFVAYGAATKLGGTPIYAMAGGAAGGIVCGLMGARAYTMGYSTVMALPIFEDTIVAMAIGIAVAIIVGAIVTYVIGYDESDR